MGIFRRGSDTGRPEDYVELEVDDMSTPPTDGNRLVRIAAITEQRDALEIQDAVHNGDIVIADLATLTTSGPTVEHVIDELRTTVEELGGDIVKKGDDQLILTPSGVEINRKKLGR